MDNKKNLLLVVECEKANFNLAKIEISPCDALHLSRDDMYKICFWRLEEKPTTSILQPTT